MDFYVTSLKGMYKNFNFRAHYTFSFFLLLKMEKFHLVKHVNDNKENETKISLAQFLNFHLMKANNGA